jgi:hypothetical protein
MNWGVGQGYPVATGRVMSCGRWVVHRAAGARRRWREPRGRGRGRKPEVGKGAAVGAQRIWSGKAGGREP